MDEEAVDSLLRADEEARSGKTVLHAKLAWRTARGTPRKQGVLNNDGDSISLRDADGSIVSTLSSDDASQTEPPSTTAVAFKWADGTVQTLQSSDGSEFVWTTSNSAYKRIVWRSK